MKFKSDYFLNIFNKVWNENERLGFMKCLIFLVYVIYLMYFLRYNFE